MTESIIFPRTAAPTVRAAVVIAKALLRWAEARVQRTQSREDLVLRAATAAGIQSREHAALRRALRS